MPLIALWTSNPAAIAEFSIEQIVASAGDGILRDNSLCSIELTTYLSQISSETLANYVTQCLSAKFDKGGMVLQDLINEFGRRLDYSVTNGLYQGRVNAIGFDGLWTSPEGSTTVIEVKTTDAYRISLDTLATYRNKLLSSGVIQGTPSILIVVGRQDTGELEAQIRGSRHAWDIRLISAEALMRLAMLKENSTELETARKIRSILIPVEYTRLDRLVDVVFTAAADVSESLPETNSYDESTQLEATEILPSDVDSRRNKGKWGFTSPALLQQKRDDILKAMSARDETTFITKSRALYWNADHSSRFACTISKRYPKKALYWYAFHPQWATFLEEAANAHLLLGCMDISTAFAIPYHTVKTMLPGLNTTQMSDSEYWHITIVEGANRLLEIPLPKQARTIEISQFAIELRK